MKHWTGYRKPAAVLLVLVLLAAVFGAAAESVEKPAAKSAVVAELLQVLDFKFHVRDEGIGEGTYPVYTAPSKDSLRLADGKARVDVSGEVSVAGYDHGWLLIRYEIKDKKARVGYILHSKDMLHPDVGKISFNAVPAQLVEETEITDNPRSNSTPFGTLPAGSDITILAKYTYTGNWWYIEAENAGKQMRGFIDRSATPILVDGTVYNGNTELGFPAVSPGGGEQIGMVLIGGDGDNARIVRKRPDPDSDMVARVYSGDVFPCYGTEIGSTWKEWYQIWVDGVWGWYSSGSSTLIED